MYSRLSTEKRCGFAAYCALIIASLAGCYGDSELGHVDPTSGTDTPAVDGLAVDGLGANDAAFGDEVWAELALDFEEFVPEPGIGQFIRPEDWISTGRWGELIEWPEIAVGAANMTDGRIVTWASFVDDFFGESTEVTTASVFDPATGTFEDAGYTGHNAFCAGVSMLPDGRVFLAGGGTHVSTVSVFEDNKFREIDSMAMARWYPTSTTLASGQVVTSLGTTASSNSEIWTQGYGWQLLDNVDLQSAFDFPYNYNDWYPALNVSPDGSLFHPGPNNELFSINLDQDDAHTAHGPREVDGGDRLYNTTVIYDVGKMLVAGGGQLNAQNTALTIDLNGASPVVEPTEPMANARTMQNTVVLPNGEVLVIGGNTSGKQFSDEGTVLTPEIWSPDTGEWREVAPHQKPRNYHSTALLLQDGRVISMGGGLCGLCKTNHQDGEIFEPPYLFDGVGQKADRPSINNGPASAQAGDAITLTGSDDIVKFNMVRLVAVTHHHSTDQRLVPVPFNKVTTGNYELQLNANPNVLIPGYYWIFGLNDQGVPTVGHQIEVKITTDPFETPATTDTNVNFAYYEGLWDELPDFSALTPVATGTQANFSLNNRQRNWAYGFVFNSTITVPSDDVYTFYLSSDDGSRLSINGNVVVNHDGIHRFEAEKTGSVFLAAGEHDISVQYYENNANDGLLVSWSGSDMVKRPVTRFDLGSEVVAISNPVAPEEPAVAPVVSQPELLVNYSYYEGNWNTLPAFDVLTPVKSGVLSNYSLSPRENNDFYAFRFDSRITVNESGAYTFYTSSDDGSRLYVDGQLVVDNDGLHVNKESNGVVSLTAGEHDVRVEFFEKTGRDNLEVLWSGPGFEKQPIADTVFVEIVEVAAVFDTPVSYSYYEGNWNVLPQFDQLQAVKTGALTNFSLQPREKDDFYGFRFDSVISVTDDGDYTFYIQSDDGSRLYINDQMIVDHDGLHPIQPVRSGVVALAPGEHKIRVEFFEKSGKDDLIVSWSGPGFGRQVIADTALAANAVDSTSGAPANGTTTSEYSVASVWDYDLYFGFWNALPDFASLTPAVTSVTSDLDLSVSPVNSKFAIRFRGSIDIGEAGAYTFYTESDDGSQLLIDGQLVVDNNGLHALIEKQGAVTLAAGVHDVEIRYLQGFGGKGFLTSWAGPGFGKTVLLPGDTTTEPDITTTPDSQINLLPQLNYEYFEGAWNNLPDFESLQPVQTGVVNNFNLSVAGAVNQYGVRYAGLINVEQPGDYTFYVRSNDGSRLSIGGQLVVDNDGRHGALEKQGDIALQAGLHEIELGYFQNLGGETLEVFWSGPGFGKQLVPDGVLFQSQ